MATVRSSARPRPGLLCLSALTLALALLAAACGGTVRKETDDGGSGSGGSIADSGTGGSGGSKVDGGGGTGGTDNDGGPGQDTGGPADTSGPPTITATTPSHAGTGVAVDSSLTVEFSESMDRATVTLTLAPTVALRAPAWTSSNDTVTFIPQAALAPNTMYTATVTGSDAGGTALAGTKTFSFTTGMPADTTAPTITATSPANAATNVALNAPITVTFSEAVDPATVSVKLGGNTLDVMLNDTNTVATATTPALTAATMYTVAVEATDTAGNALGGTKTFTFTTGAPADAVKPTVVSTAPDSAATNVATTTEIAITFSEAMNHAVTEGAITISGGVACAGRWLWNGTSTFMSCRPAAALTASTMYTVTIGTAAADPAGNTLAAAHMFSFTIAAAPDTVPPTIVSVLPANAATGVAQAANISVTFSEPMDLASAQTAFQVTVNGTAVTAMGTYTWSAGGRTLTFNPTSMFPHGATVAFGVSMAAKDAAGNAKVANNDYSITIIRLLSATIYAVPALDGYVYGNGTVFATLTSFIIGDVASNIYAHAFVTFDLTQLNIPAAMAARSRIVAATLYANQSSITGEPYATVTPAAANLGSLLVDHVSYGPTLDASDLMTSTLGARTSTLSTTITAGAKAVSVSASVVDDWANRTTRNSASQFRLRFTRNVTANATADYARFVSGNDTVTPLMRPRLIVSYETP